MRRPGNVVAPFVLAIERMRALFEKPPVGDDGALRRNERAQAMAARPALKVRIGFGGADPRRRPFDANLPFERFPEEYERDPSVGGHFVGLAAFVVGVKGETALVEAAEQYDAGGGSAAG